MYKPKSTYRIQFHKEFNFKNLRAQIPYLKSLGIDTLYASPIFKAIPGSTHGYDVVDPHQINPEIGTEAELIELAKELKDQGIGWVQDIVPNHMAFHNNNTWLMDVLAKWDQSPYFKVFDFLLDREDPDAKLLVPFLGEPLADAIASKSIQLVKQDGVVCLNYGEQFWPIATETIPSFENDLSSVKWLEAINNDHEKLRELISYQHFAPEHYTAASTKLNYRRFFTVNELICLRMEDASVFDLYHEYLLKLFRSGVFQGFRIDHIDGLAEPQHYLSRLSTAMGSDAYAVVEKILGSEEEVVSEWATAGTTGYDFLAQVNQLLVNESAKPQFDEAYMKWTNNDVDFDKQALTKKHFILANFMQSEVNYLLANFQKLLPAHLQKPNSNDEFRDILADFLVEIPVYRYYFDQEDWLKNAYKPLEQIAASIPKNNDAAILFFETLFPENKQPQQTVIDFLNRCMQFASPLTAKGIEDTLFYTFNRLLVLNEVGDHPKHFGMSIKQFHEKMKYRAEQQPYALNASSTHDTKRGEDVRARLAALSADANLWTEFLEEVHDNKWLFVADSPIHPNDAYQLLQTVLGTLPLEGPIDESYQDRVAAATEKGIRESKKRSTWEEPNEDYETQLQAWLREVLHAEHPFVVALRNLLKTIEPAAVLNSLNQITLKTLCPGIPDFYQGSEDWNFSLVDPDNRRPVDYEQLNATLNELATANLAAVELTEKSHIKLGLTKQLLQIRNDNSAIFEKGTYIPLTVTGTYQDHVIAFLRQMDDQLIFVVLPLYLSPNGEQQSILQKDWKDTAVQLPEWAPNLGSNLISKQTVYRNLETRNIPLSKLLASFPIAVVKLTYQSQRGSGLLTHLSSLPTPFGIGDMGTSAYQFIDFLHENKQRYWQLLPLNPTSKGSFHSPYSSYSAFAGNPLFISPILLQQDGWLLASEIAEEQHPETNSVDFDTATEIKTRLLRTAFERFSQNADTIQKDAWNRFCTDNQDWLHDFALFETISSVYEGNWDQWPKELKFRNEDALHKHAQQHQDQILQIKWVQYVFFTQWETLRAYGKTKRVQFIGDLPFYVAHHSVDVWAHPELFTLDENECPSAFAGTPPDAFSDEGQHWGMPLYRWDVLKANDYDWWQRRLAMNLKLYDFIRLDHFRAFDAYWSIPAGETGKNGKWLPGPGHHFFDQLRETFGKLPFIAEDIGSEMEEAIKFRAELGLPGMKIIQFGFGDDAAYSEHLPHQYPERNSTVYLGTHDNNTILGWYRDEIDDETRNRLQKYLGFETTVDSVHRDLIRYALAAVSDIAILQLQDVLGLGSESRMNTPGTIDQNWLWAYKSEALYDKDLTWLPRYTEDYGRF